MSKPNLGIPGRVAAFSQRAQITPLLALVMLLLGIFAVLVTPREEEPQINVTMANVIVPFPGASVADVEHMVSTPAEQILSGIAGVEHVLSASQPGLALLTVQFKVGVPRSEALVRLYDAVHSNADWLPAGLGTLPPLVKPMGIDDVPIVSLTLFEQNQGAGATNLQQVAHSIEIELKRVAGVRDVRTIGGSDRAIMVDLDPARMAGFGITVADLRMALQASNSSLPVGELVSGNTALTIDAGTFLRDARDVAELVVGVQGGKPIFLQDLAQVRDAALPASQYVWHGVANVKADSDPDAKVGTPAGEYPAVTLAITKKSGENAIDVANALMQRVDALKNTVIPAEVGLAETRNYGASANEKAQKLIQKLLFATLSVIALVFIALGRREAAIVVVENIHRHQRLFPNKSLAAIIPGAVDEVGGPTILATFTVIAALLPMAFVSGLMGPYMSPIPINASMGMLLSLAIAFTVTPWLARLWMKSSLGGEHAAPQGLSHRLGPWVARIFRPFLDDKRGGRARGLFGLGIAVLIALSLVLPATGLVLLKMLPSDNKSEFQIIVDMPEGTPLEQTAAVLRELGAYLRTVPEVTDYQAYAGSAAPINFNGLVRQYYLRSSAYSGDVQVNLVDKHHRDEQSHAIAMRLRPELQAIGQRLGASVKIAEVPPGPPVQAPIVAEIYGATPEGRREVAQAVRAVFAQTAGVVDIDDSSSAVAPRTVLLVNRAKAATLGISQQAIVSTLHAGLSGEAASYLHDGSKYPAVATLALAPELQGDLNTLLQLSVRSASGALVPISELVTISDSVREQPIFHKDLLPVDYVTGDMAGAVDSPLYGMFKMRGALEKIKPPGGGKLGEYFISQPQDPYREYALKWDGEWQITYETFRDMGAAYAVGLILIYLLVVAQFGSYLTPLIIMAPIPLTIIGVMPGHALLGAQYTATSMIGMIALAGIIVRNSILLVDFINLQVREGLDLKAAVVQAVAARAQPIVLTGLAAMFGAFFILDDPIFNGLAISLIFGILVSTALTLVAIPLLYYSAYRNRVHLLKPEGETL